MVSTRSSLRRRRALEEENDADSTNADHPHVADDPAQESQQQQQDKEDSLYQEEDSAVFLDSPSLADIDTSLRRASLATLAVWVMLLAVANRSGPRDSLERLEGWERSSALVALVALACNVIYRMGPLLMKRAVPLTGGGVFFMNDVPLPLRSRQFLSGILVAGLTTQGVAIATNALLAFHSVPILVDPVTLQRVSMLRWAEFVSLAFLMTYATEAFGIHDKHTMPLSVPLLHALCQGLSTLMGMLFPYCPNPTIWYALLVISCCLFGTIFVRLSQKQTAFDQMTVGRSLQEAIAYDRARLSLKMLWACTISWTLFPVIFFTCGFLVPALAPPSSFWNDPALALVCDAFLDIASKLVHMNIIMDVHNGIFDDPDGVRALQKLEQVKIAIGEKWATANDVVIISVRQEFSGTVTSMVSPSKFLLPTKKGPQDKDDPLVFVLGWEHFRGTTSGSHATNHSVRPSLRSGAADPQQLAAFAGLVVRAWGAHVLPRATLSHDFTVAQCTCDAEVTRLEEHLLVVVVRGYKCKN